MKNEREESDNLENLDPVGVAAGVVGGALAIVVFMALMILLLAAHGKGGGPVLPWLGI